MTYHATTELLQKLGGDTGSISPCLPEERHQTCREELQSLYSRTASDALHKSLTEDTKQQAIYQAMIHFKDPKKQLPEPNRQLLLQIESPYTYEQGYIYDGKNFRRCVFEVGEIVTKPVFGWAYIEEFHHHQQNKG